MQANMNQQFANLSLHQPGHAPNPGHDEIIYEDIEDYTPEAVEAYDNVQQQQSYAKPGENEYMGMIPPAKPGENEYMGMIPPAKPGENEYMGMIPPVAQEEEQYVDTQPPTLDCSKPEEVYEHYVDVEPPTSESSKPEEEHYVEVEPPTTGQPHQYMALLPQNKEMDLKQNECYGTNADMEPLYDAINYEAMTSLRNPITVHSNKTNVAKSQVGRPLPPTPTSMPKRKAPRPPLKAQSSGDSCPPPLKAQSSADSHPPPLMPRLKQLSLPAEPIAVHTKLTSQLNQELHKVLAPKPQISTENTEELPPPLPPKPAAPSVPTTPEKLPKDSGNVSSVAPSTEPNVQESVPAVVVPKRQPPTSQVVRASVERAAPPNPKPQQVLSPGTSTESAVSVQRAASPNPKPQKVVSPNTSTESVASVERVASAKPKPQKVVSPNTSTKSVASVERVASPNPKPQKVVSTNTSTKSVEKAASPNPKPQVAVHGVVTPNTSTESAASVERSTSPNPKPQKVVSAGAAAMFTTAKPQGKEPVHSSAASPSEQSVKPGRKAPNPPLPYANQTLPNRAPLAHHPSAPALQDQKVGHIPRQSSEPTLSSEAPPPYHEIYPQQPQQPPYPNQAYPQQQPYPQQPYPQQQPRPQQPYPQQQPRPQQPYPQQAYPQQTPYPQQPYPQQQPRPQQPYPQQQPRPQQPYPQQPYPQQQPRPQQPYPQQPYPQQQPRPQQPYPQQPYPQQQPRPQQPYPQQPYPQQPYRYPSQAYPQQSYPPYPPQPLTTTPYRQPYPQQGPGYRAPYPVQQYRQQAQPQQSSFVRIHTGAGGVMTIGTGAGGTAHSVVVGTSPTSVPVKASGKKGKKKK